MNNLLRGIFGDLVVLWDVHGNLDLLAGVQVRADDVGTYHVLDSRHILVLDAPNANDVNGGTTDLQILNI